MPSPNLVLGPPGPDLSSFTTKGVEVTLLIYMPPTWPGSFSSARSSIYLLVELFTHCFKHPSWTHPTNSALTSVKKQNLFDNLEWLVLYISYLKLFLLCLRTSIKGLHFNCIIYKALQTKFMQHVFK